MRRYYYTIEVVTRDPLVGDQEDELKQVIADYFDLDSSEGDRVFVSLDDEDEG